ncbi:MAG TPA: Holliday junction resolvase RuvX [Bacteroidales bacterium]|nr:Holliday junction resolvase RuvX [Bacteroidales bacterium]
MARILAIDYGKKRAGFAVTDPLQMIASPLATVPAGEAESFISEYIAKEDVVEIVIGYPVTLNNEPSESVKYIEPFIKKIKKTFPGIVVTTFDERFTSRIAFRAMIDGGLRKKERRDKGMVDRISASVILQSFLERRAFLKEKERLR